VLEQLQRLALGFEAPPVDDWESVNEIEAMVVPTIAWNLGKDAPVSLKGLLRYTWCRHQVLLKKATEIHQQSNTSLFLADDLNLGAQVYPHPGARAIEGIDFLVQPNEITQVENRLGEHGWRRPTWQAPPEYLELRPDFDTDLRLRLYRDWLPGLEEKANLEWAAPEKGLQYLPPEEQFWRTCWMRREPLWLLDAWHLIHLGAGQRSCTLSDHLVEWGKQAKQRFGPGFLFPRAK
jgi:hypothetical protein